MTATPSSEEPGGGGFVTLGEVVRRLADVQQAVHSLVEKLDRDYARATDLARTDGRVDRLEETNRWVARIIVGAVILALLGLVLVKGDPT